METAITILIIVIALAILVGAVLAIITYRRVQKVQDVVVNQVFQHGKGFDEDFFKDFDDLRGNRLR